jgi:anti-sigma factor RsiW
VDVLDDRPVAALVYRRREHIINLFIWPIRNEPVEGGNERFSRQGYHQVYWAQADMNYWAVSDLNERELAEFVQLVQGK